MGASDVVNGKNTDPVATVKHLTHGGAHISVDALGIAATCQNALMSLRKLGRHVQILLGMLRDRPCETRCSTYVFGLDMC